jgi:hypothetical protein
VFIHSGVAGKPGPTGNVIGGIEAGSANVISGNGIGVTISDEGTTDNQVEGNLIGTNGAGTAKLGTASVGVLVTKGADDNAVGGAGPDAGNVISGNGVGVQVAGPDTSGTLVQGNFIGTDLTGSFSLGNTGDGVFLSAGATESLVGGLVPDAANVISGNGRDGVEITGAKSNANQVAGNLIGTTGTGTAPLGNVRYGVEVATTDNLVGGTDPGAGNTVAFNQKGVVVRPAAIGVSILGNSVFGNTKQGIDLSDNGAGPGSANESQPAPTLTATTRVQGPDTVLVSVAVAVSGRKNTDYRIEFFVSPVPAAGQPTTAQTYLEALTLTVTTDNAGKATVTLDGGLFPPNALLVATATDLTTGDTSEFSAAVPTTQAP